MSDNTANGRNGAGDRASGSDRLMSPRLRHIIRQRDLEDIRQSTEDLLRRQESSEAMPSGPSAARRNRSDWRVVYGDASGTQTVLPPIEDLMARTTAGRARTVGYRRANASSAREDRADRLSSILPPLPAQSEEAVDIEMTNQRMDETEDDPPVRYRTLGSRFGTATDLEVLLGGDEYDFEFARARHPSRLRQSATAITDNPAADVPAVAQDVDATERRWIEQLYMQFPPAAREALSPHVRTILSQRRAAEAGQPETHGRDALWNMMMQESQTDDEEDEESEWEVSSSPGEIPLGGASRVVGDILSDLMATSRRDEATTSHIRHPALPPAPSRPATNAYLRSRHVPQVVGTSSNRVLSARRAAGRNDVQEATEEDAVGDLGAGLRRRKSIKRRRVEAGIDTSYPYPIMKSTPSAPIAKETLPAYMQIVNTPILTLPTSFNPLDKCVRLSITPAGAPEIAYGPLVVVKFTGTGARGDADAAAVRTDQPISSACAIYYYEATIVSKGQEGFISIGFSNQFTNLSRLVGWEPGSFAWHMDDGFVFEGRGEGISKGWPTSTTGDVIGCGIDFTTGQAFFTKNGQLIGHAFKNVGREDKLYPSIGLRTPGETVQCNFKGPFKYDIVEHVRKAQRETIDSVLRKEYVAISAPAGQAASDVKAVPPSTVPADKPGKAKTAQKTTTPPASPQKVVRNIDGALAPAVLSYLQHNGFFGSAAAMRKDMNSRKRLLETGLGQGDESRSAKVAKTDKWYEAQEDSWRRIHKIKADYAANRLSSVWHQLREGTGPSIGFAHFLESDDGLWACRLRIRYFYKVLLKYLGQDKERDIASSTERKTSLSEDLADADFKTFLFGATSPSPEPPHESAAEGDASNVLLALGNHLRVEHGSSPSSVIKQAAETALSYMSYNHLSELPKDVYSDMSQVGLAREAAELVKAIRDYQGKPTCSALEEAFASTDRALSDLGRLHNVASAGFLGVEGIAKARG